MRSSLDIHSLTCQQSNKAAGQVKEDVVFVFLDGCFPRTFNRRPTHSPGARTKKHSKAHPEEPNGKMRISLKGKCGTQMCGGLERKSDVKHTSVKL